MGNQTTKSSGEKDDYKIEEDGKLSIRYQKSTEPNLPKLPTDIKDVEIIFNQYNSINKFFSDKEYFNSITTLNLTGNRLTSLEGILPIVDHLQIIQVRFFH